MSTDYRATVFLPRTDFPMKAGLPKHEPALLERWRATSLYERLRAASEGREPFVLHDGPPYANGHIHIGTALNKILKDVINRSQQMMGKNATYVPGWDCHGLPIEWQVEQAYIKAKKNKDDVPIIQFRHECREFAEKWIDIQRDEFIRLGVIGDWDHPYTTMDPTAEAQIVREIIKFLMNGGLYKGAKPVLWSVVEKTALAEAEVEYGDHRSTTVYVRFKVLPTNPRPNLHNASVVIWTTTPWTLPGNRAIAVSPQPTYVRLKVTGTADDSLAVAGEEIIIAKALIERVVSETGITAHDIIEEFPGAQLEGVMCQHPLRGSGYDFDVTVWPGDFVDMEQGTGFVHIAPGHGADDFVLGAAHGIEVPETVDGDGRYVDSVPLFAGQHVFKVDDEIAAAIEAQGGLLAKGKLVHSYPHSWRSKAPLIFRTTPQWFISMIANDLRSKALHAIDEVRWIPPTGRNRIHAMIENRPEWVISRQRAWGVPITVFVNKETGEPLRDDRVNERIIDAVAEGGADVWFADDGSRFLGAEYDLSDYEKVNDIIDVWFESGATHAFVLEARPDLIWPATIYVEGSDQHRGWFHSSLLESCGTRGRAPYEQVLTHGFVVDEEGRKMSKSVGNIVQPQEVISQHGADILRLWAVSSDYSEDLHIGPEIIQHQVDAYRRLRNTLRFVLGNLTEFDEGERVAHDELPELERWVRHRLAELDQQVRQSCNDFDFHALFVALYTFCTVDLSSFYLDVRKDALYCDGATSHRRRAARTVLDDLFNCLTAWLAPILCFTAEEVWLSRFPSPDDSVHLRTFPEISNRNAAGWRDPTLAAKWEKVRALRRVLTGALEIERREKRIGSSLQAWPRVYATADYVDVLDGIDLAEFAITSGVELVPGEAPSSAFSLEDVPGVGVEPQLADGEKCQRCWRVLPEVRASARDICQRCSDAVDAIAA